MSETLRLYAPADPGPPAHRLGDRLWWGGRKYGSKWVIVTGMRLEPELVDGDEGQPVLASVRWEYHVTTESSGRAWGWTTAADLLPADPDLEPALESFAEARGERDMQVQAIVRHSQPGPELVVGVGMPR